MSLRTITLISVAALLSGCAAVYTYNGAKYDSAEALAAGVQSSQEEALRAITPLPKPLTENTLIFAIPSEETIKRESVANFRKINGRSPGLGEEIILGHVVATNYKSIKFFYDIIQRKNIYKSVKYLERDTSAGDLQAVNGQDVLYWSEPQLGSGQWYYTTIKSGKQAFAFDRGGANMSERANAFTQAVQVFAIRD